MSTMTKAHHGLGDRGRAEMTFEAGAGQAGRRLRRRPRGRHDGAGDGRRPNGGARRRRLLPLTVDVEERMYAAGKIPGGFFKREGRPTERAILTARMIDRPIRPLWPSGYKNEVHVVATTLSADLVGDILCINGASAALMVSPLPFLGPVGAVRIGEVDGDFVVNPTLPVVEEESTLDLIVVGSRDALTMIEAGADEIPEDDILEAFELAHAEIVKICDAQEDLRRQAGKPKYLDPELTSELESQHAGRIRERIEADGLREGARSSRSSVERARHGAEHGVRAEDILRQIQVRVARRDPREDTPGGRRALRPRAVRERPARADRGRAGLEGAQVGEAPAPLRPDHRGGRAAVPGRPGHGRRRGAVVKDSLTKQFVKRAAESVYKQLVRQKIAVDKRRPDGRGARTSARSPARSASRRGRTARRSSPAARLRS